MNNKKSNFDYSEEKGHAEDIEDIDYDIILDKLNVNKDYYNNLSDITIETSNIRNKYMLIYDNINDNDDDKKIFVKLLNLYINLTKYDDNIKKVYNYNISNMEYDSRLLFDFFNNLLLKTIKGGKNKKIYKSTDNKIKFKYDNKIFTRTIYI